MLLFFLDSFQVLSYSHLDGSLSLVDNLLNDCNLLFYIYSNNLQWILFVSYSYALKSFKKPIKFALIYTNIHTKLWSE